MHYKRDLKCATTLNKYVLNSWVSLRH